MIDYRRVYCMGDSNLKKKFIYCFCISIAVVYVACSGVRIVGSDANRRASAKSGERKKTEGEEIGENGKIVI